MLGCAVIKRLFSVLCYGGMGRRGAAPGRGGAFVGNWGTGKVLAKSTGGAAYARPNLIEKRDETKRFVKFKSEYSEGRLSDNV